MQRYTNTRDIPLATAVFLARDTYDYQDDAISATGLIRPTRQIILADRVPATEQVVDIADLVKSRIGQAIHSAIEEAWEDRDNVIRAMIALGYPEKVAQRVLINPDPKTVKDGDLPVYIEQRRSKIVSGVKVTGKFDMVAEGRVQDFKSTSTFLWNKESKDDDYRLQGSIYRWLNPDIIKDDFIQINYLFPDFMAARAANDDYPASAAPHKLVRLMSIEETDFFIRQKIATIKKLKEQPEEELPQCSEKELWMDTPDKPFGYYANPDNLQRASKRFVTAAEAHAYQASKGKGVVVEKKGKAKACRYCPAFSACSQKDDLARAGLLDL